MASFAKQQPEQPAIQINDLSMSQEFYSNFNWRIQPF